MARDSEGRPIPVSRPDPPNDQARATAEQEQFVLIAKKIDDALRHLEDLARRVGSLEVGGEQTLNTKIFDFEQRFDTMMLARMTDFERRFDAMAQAVAEAVRTRPPPPSEPIEPATS
jgi:hypothetical protein